MCGSTREAAKLLWFVRPAVEAGLGLEVLKIFRRRQLYAKSSKCEFGRQELGFLGHRPSQAGCRRVGGPATGAVDCR